MTASQVHSAVETGEGTFKIDDREVGMVCSVKDKVVSGYIKCGVKWNSDC